VVSRALVVVERGGAVLFFVAGRVEEVAPSSSRDAGRSDRVCAAVSRGMSFFVTAWRGR